MNEDRIRWAEFEVLCERELELCALKEHETVVVLSQAGDRQDYADAFIAAANRLGAEAYNIRLGKTSSVLGGSGVWAVGINPLAGNESALRALKDADLVIDTVFLLWSHEQLEIQAAGTRMLMVIEPRSVLARMFPTADQRRRVEASGELLRKARTLRMTNTAGTDVVYELGDCPVMETYGYTDTPGRWDHWPTGFVLTGAGTPSGVSGRVVVDAGDIIVAPFGRYVADPIELTIEDGVVQDLRGRTDANLLQDYLAEFDDPRGYAVSHIGWGCNENARWCHLANSREGFGQEARAFYGNAMFALGPNLELGGDNDTPAHIDIPMRNCSVFLDDEPVLVDGEFVIDELKQPGRRTAATVGARP
ncbi:MAG TPA: 2,5-dihydroxypyridine 5,6-dioxygenase [Solirubrobacteraceae bacterium]|nr:2,5-dihydroxypyridine 5,6-dioxygenase [Solirubrobacteraceae bacterium]